MLRRARAGQPLDPPNPIPQPIRAARPITRSSWRARTSSSATKRPALMSAAADGPDDGDGAAAGVRTAGVRSAAAPRGPETAPPMSVEESSRASSRPSRRTRPPAPVRAVGDVPQRSADRRARCRGCGSGRRLRSASGSRPPHARRASLLFAARARHGGGAPVLGPRSRVRR
jgi:hypothetical protein